MDAVVEVLTTEGWTQKEFDNIESIHIAGAPGADGIQFTLIGERPDSQNQIETGILDVAPRHERVLKNPVPRTDNGESVPVSVRDSTPNPSEPQT